MKKMLGLILIGLFAVSCAHDTRPTPAVTWSGSNSTETDGEVQIVRVDVNGRPVTCVIWKQWAGYGAAGGITCDWGH